MKLNLSPPEDMTRLEKKYYQRMVMAAIIVAKQINNQVSTPEQDVAYAAEVARRLADVKL
jgi:hypothetical protein